MLICTLKYLKIQLQISNTAIRGNGNARCLNGRFVLFSGPHMALVRVRKNGMDECIENVLQPRITDPVFPLCSAILFVLCASFGPSGH